MPAILYFFSFSIRSINPAVDFASKLSSYLRAKGYKKIGVVLAQNTYVQGLYNGIKEQLNPDQKIEIVEEYLISATDFRDSVLKVRTKHYDAIGVFLISGKNH